MKTNLSILHYLCRAAANLATLFLTGCGPSATATDSKPAAPSPAQPSLFAIAIVDDHTGGQAPGALTEQTAKQLASVRDIAGFESLHLEYLLVQESVPTPVALTLPGWQMPPLPKQPSDNLPYEKYLREMAKFMAAVKASQQARGEWQKTTNTNLETFLHEAVSAQQALAERWATELQRRGMLDFRRSSVADTILAAAQALPVTTVHSFIILATDGIDEPPGKPGRKTPFTAIELPPQVHLIYLTPDGSIPRSPLFKGLKNPSMAVKELAGAVDYIKKVVIEPQQVTSFVTN